MQPSKAVELYLETRSNELAEATLTGYRSRLKHFVRWCEGDNIEDTREIGPREYHEHRLWRRRQGDPKKVYMKTYQNTMRGFVRFLESIDEAPGETAEKIMSPSLSRGENVDDTTLDHSVAVKIREYLDRYEHATREHVVFELATHALLRRGAIRGIDVDDLDSDDHVLHVEHRPGTGTPLKNKHEGTRYVTLDPRVTRVITRYVRVHRPEMTDEHGRGPLLATSHGRPHVTTIQADLYSVTRPCRVTGTCPHGRTIDECDAAKDRQQAFRCPSSMGPHAARRGGITHFLASDVPRRAVEDRADTTVIDEHYDRRTERDKAEQRRRYLDLVD